MQEVPCFCGGSNDNCRFCSGTGMRPAKNSGSTGTISSGSRRPAVSLLGSGLQRGLSNSGSAAASGYVLGGRKRKSRQQRSESNTMATNFTKPQKMPPGRVSVKTSSVVPVSTRNLLRCSQCGCAVREDRLERHLRNVHGERTAPQAKATRMSHTITDRSVPAVPATTEEETQQQRLLDATKDYAHAFREQGRFGSHPSHDRFDDDSNP